MTDHKADVERYVAGVLDGSIKAGSLVIAAVKRYVQDLETGHERGLRFDEAAANYAINFVCCLSHTTGEYAGEPFIPRQFQKFIFWNIFGWKRANGTRRFRKAFISLARGNGKSPLGAAIANVCFRADTPPEPRAEIYSVATKEKQARIVWEEASQQIHKSKSKILRDAVVIQKRNMHIPSNGSRFEALGSDSDTNDGWNVHCAILDELHAWGDRHRGLFDVIETAMGKRRQPLLVIITTAGSDDSQLWIEEYDWCVQVVHGQQDADDRFVYIAEVDKERDCAACEGKGCDECDNSGKVEVDVLDPSEWPCANPMLNEPESTVKADELLSLAKKARVTPTAARKFRRYYANQIVCSHTRLFNAELWMRGNAPVKDLTGRKCYLGYDGGSKDDLASIAAIFPLDDGTFDCRIWAWICSESPHDLHSDPWLTFVREESLTVTDGNTTDIDSIYKTVEWIKDHYQVQSLAFDPNNAREFGTRCANQWGFNTYAFPQNCGKYNEPILGLIGALKDGQIRHGGNKLLAWCAMNAVARTDSMDHMMPCKPKSKGKIDPVVALLMAFSEAKFAEQVPDSNFSFEII